MAVLTGVNGELLINGITVAKCRSLQLNQQRDAIEVTPLGDEWRTYVSGLKRVPPVRLRCITTTQTLAPSCC